MQFRKKSIIFVWIGLMVLCGCSSVPHSPAYQEMYAHLKQPRPCTPSFKQSDCFLVILTNARHLDYSTNHSFFKTVAKHPDDGCKQGDVGHAWIFLQGVKDGELVYLEGGYSGESGRFQARYFDGVMNNIDYGYANPTPEQMNAPRYEENPAKYLWEIQHDGFFQWGPGCHRPTYAAKVNITQEQFELIWTFINNYPYREYSLINSQCSSFAAQIASLGGLDLDCEVHIPIDANLKVGKTYLHFWSDPCYSLLTVASPDMIEKGLMEAVQEERAEYALDWYKKAYPEPWEVKMKRWRKTVSRFPKRFIRYLFINS